MIGKINFFTSNEAMESKSKNVMSNNIEMNGELTLENTQFHDNECVQAKQSGLPTKDSKLKILALQYQNILSSSQAEVSNSMILIQLIKGRSIYTLKKIVLHKQYQLNLAECNWQLSLNHTIIIETNLMKARELKLILEALQLEKHRILQQKQLIEFQRNLLRIKNDKIAIMRLLLTCHIELQIQSQIFVEINDISNDKSIQKQKQLQSYHETKESFQNIINRIKAMIDIVHSFITLKQMKSVMISLLHKILTSKHEFMQNQLYDKLARQETESITQHLTDRQQFLYQCKQQMSRLVENHKITKILVSKYINDKIKIDIKQRIRILCLEHNNRLKSALKQRNMINEIQQRRNNILVHAQQLIDDYEQIVSETTQKQSTLLKFVDFVKISKYLISLKTQRQIMLCFIKEERIKQQQSIKTGNQCIIYIEHRQSDLQLMKKDIVSQLRLQLQRLYTYLEANRKRLVNAMQILLSQKRQTKDFIEQYAQNHRELDAKTQAAADYYDIYLFHFQTWQNFATDVAVFKDKRYQQLQTTLAQAKDNIRISKSVQKSLTPSFVPPLLMAGVRLKALLIELKKYKQLSEWVDAAQVHVVQNLPRILQETFNVDVTEAKLCMASFYEHANLMGVVDKAYTKTKPGSHVRMSLRMKRRVQCFFSTTTELVVIKQLVVNFQQPGLDQVPREKNLKNQFFDSDNNKLSTSALLCGAVALEGLRML